MPISLTGEKKLAATAAWLAEPPSKRGFSDFGVLMESRAVEPTMSTLIWVMEWWLGFKKIQWPPRFCWISSIS